MDGLRARVQRLLNGECRSDDISRLFLYARDHCDGRQSVREIGDFVAHHNERTKGIITEEVRDWYRTAAFMALVVTRKINWVKLPADFAEFLDASVRRTPPKMIKHHSGLQHAHARSIARNIIRRLVRNDDGTVSLPTHLSGAEGALIKILCGNITARPALDHQRLFVDFTATLRSNALLKKDEVTVFNALRPAIALFAVSEMHDCVIQLGNGNVSRLRAGVGASAHICVDAPLEEPAWSSAIFSTDLKAAEYCTPELLDVPPPWSFPLELVAPGLLAQLR